MAVLQRGANVALTREIPSLTGLVVGVRIDAGAEKAVADNLVVAAILCDRGSRALSDEHFVFFNQLTSPEETVRQLEHALGDDTEQIEIDLTAVPADVERIVVVMYLNEGMVARRSLAQLRELRVRAINLADNAELIRSENLAGFATNEIAMALAEVYRHQGGWKFKVIGEAYSKGIAGIASDYGLVL